MSKLLSMKVFCCAADTLNFSRTAENLNYSPAMVSKHIAGLEDHLGVRLFTRSTRKIRLTAQGRLYHQQCQKLLYSLEEIESRIRTENQMPSGTLRISLPADFGVAAIAPLLAGFIEAYPDIRIDSIYNERCVDSVAEGFDLVILKGNRLPDSSLVATRVGVIHMVLCASPEYLERHPAIEEVQDLRFHNCIVSSQAFDKSWWHFSGPMGDESVKVSGNLRSNSHRAMRLSVLNGLGVAVLPYFLAREHLEHGRLVEVLAGYHAPEIGVHALYPHQAHLPIRVRCFIDYLKQSLDARDGGLSPGLPRTDAALEPPSGKAATHPVRQRGRSR